MLDPRYNFYMQLGNPTTFHINYPNKQIFSVKL